MFLATTVLSASIPSGSGPYYDPNYVLDVSNYSRGILQCFAGNGIGGTGSFAFTSVQQSDVQANYQQNVPEFGAAYIITIDMPAEQWVTASVPDMVAKWALFQFEPTEASGEGVTGSVFVKGAFSNW